jgi:glutathione S-transferase
MILYYVPGACSLADHIALIEAGLPYQLTSIDRAKRTADGRDFLAINPKGYVPTLELDDGTLLTENLAILVYIAEQRGTLLPKQGIARFRALEATSFMTTEIHGNLKPFFRVDAGPEEKSRAQQQLLRHFALLAAQLGEQPFLLGDRLTIADPYLFWALRWAPIHGIALPERLRTYYARMLQLPSVRQALAEEGLSAV